MYIICTQQETPVFMRDFRKTPKIDVICSFFVLRSADFLMYIICTRRFFDLFSFFNFLLSQKIRGREKIIFASSSSIYHGFAIYDSNSIFCRSGPWFSQAETARSESLRLIPLVRNSSYLSWAILRRMS